MSRFAYLSAALISGAIALPAAAAMFEPPPRKAGLWTLTSTVGAHTLTSQMCIDAASDKKMSIMSQSMGKKCNTMDMDREPDGIHFHTVCSAITGGTSTTTGILKGDFSTHYTMTADITTSGSPLPFLNKTSHMQSEASWTSACAPGQKGGDVIMANGMKINMMSNDK